MAISQTQELKLQQGLNPLQIQTVHMVQLSGQEFEEEVKDELEENPFLEEAEDEDPVPSYRYKVPVSSEPANRAFDIAAQGESLQDMLRTQLGYVELSEEDAKIGDYIIGSIDDDGMLRFSVEDLYNFLSFRLGIDTTEEKIEELIEIIQGFDPAGVGARDLRECLLIQLYRKQSDNQAVIDAISILENAFKEFSNKHFDKVMRICKITTERLKEASNVIVRLNPKPCPDNVDFVEDKSKQIVPDFLVTITDDEQLQLTLPRYNIPELRINKSYLERTKKQTYSREEDRVAAEEYNKDKYNRAKNFIEAIKQRYNTLYSTMKAIMDLQSEFFLSGETADLKPLRQKDIEEATGFDISTISRVAKDRYVDTPWGIFPLKFFFSEGMENAQGEEVSNREIKEALQRAVDEEDKHNPLSDEALVSALAAMGYQVARRTISKYREQLNIPAGRLRKEI